MAKEEVGGMFRNGQTAVPLIITIHEIGFNQTPNPLKTDNSAAESIVTATARQKISKAMDMRFYWMKDRVKQKDFSVNWKTGSQNMGDYFTKHHPPRHHRKISATYLYMANALLKIDNKIVQKMGQCCAHANPTGCSHASPYCFSTVLQVFSNFVRTYGHTNNKSVTY